MPQELSIAEAILCSPLFIAIASFLLGIIASIFIKNQRCDQKLNAQYASQKTMQERLIGTLERYLSIPIKLQILLALLFIFCMIIWLNKGQNFSDLMLILTLIAVIVYSYYTFLIVKVTYKGPALLYVQQKHTSILKKFLEEKWLNKIYGIDFINAPKRDENYYKEMYKEFESYWEYKDFMENHVPEKYMDLGDNWSELKMKTIELQSIRWQVYKEIDNSIIEKLNKLQEKSPNARLGQPGDLKVFSNIIYQNYFCKYDANKSINFEVLKITEEKYQLKAFNILILEASRYEVEQLKEELESVVLYNRLDGRYKDINKVIDESTLEIDVLKDNFKAKLKELIGYTLFPGTDCNILKDFKLK
jgi:hypothetical protein